MVTEVKEKLLMVNHLSFSIEEHGSGLSEVLTGIEPLTHAVIMKTFASVFENVNSINNQRLLSLKEELLGVEEGFCHSLDLLVVVVINLSAVVKHIADVGNSETKLVDGLGSLLIGAIPEATHGVLKVLLNRICIGDTMANICHTMEVKSSDKETFH